MIARASDNLAGDGGRWQVVDARPLCYMPMREARRRARNSQRYTGARNAGALKVWVYRLALQSRDSATPPVLVDGRLYLHPRMHPCFSEPSDSLPPAEKVGGLAARDRNRGAAKARSVRDAERFVRDHGDAHGRTEAWSRFVAEHGSNYTYSDSGEDRPLKISVPSLQRWARLYRNGGLDALSVDGRGRSGKANPSEGAVDRYWKLRLDPRRFTIAHCHRVVAREAIEHKWDWFKSLRRCQVWDAATRDPKELTLRHLGDARYTADHKAYIQSDPESFEPGEAWEADDHTLDVWIRMPSGRVVRPALSAWLDWRSRVLTGYKVVAEGNQDSVLLAFRSGAKQFGLPSVVFVDNGKNFSSYAWRGDRPKRRRCTRDREFVERAEGLFNMLDVDARWVTPYSPNSKARVERFFRTLEEQFLRALPSYCGGSPDKRPVDHKLLIEKAVTWEEFNAALAKAIEAYNARPHTGEGMDGRSPLQVMQLASRKRVLDSRYDDFLMSIWHRPVKVGRLGVGITYCGKRLTYGAFDPAVCALQGKQVRVAYDPDDLSQVQVVSMEGRYLCRTELNQRVDKKLPGERLREQIRARNRQRKTLKRAHAISASDFLRDEVDATVAAMSHDSERHKRPDAPPPKGGPVLVPVQPPIEVPPQNVQPLRKAVGAEDLADTEQRFRDFVERSREAPKQPPTESGFDALRRWNERESQENA